MENENISNSSNSRYSGSYGGLLLRMFLALLISVVTIGIAVPWAIAMVYRWITAQIKINGKQVHYDGTGGQLFKWWLLPLILVIVIIVLVGAIVFTGVPPGVWEDFEYSFDGVWEDFEYSFDSDTYSFKEQMSEFIPPAAIAILSVGAIGMILLLVLFSLQVNRVLIAHTHYDGGTKSVSTFDGSYGAFFGQNILYILRMFITLFLGTPWATSRYMEWWSSKAKIDGSQLQYATQPPFLKKWMPYWIGLVVIGIAQSFADGGNSPSFFVGVIRFLWDALVYTFFLRQVIMRLAPQKPQQA